MDELHAEGRALAKQLKRMASLMIKTRDPVILNGSQLTLRPGGSNDIGLLFSQVHGSFGTTYSYHGNRKGWTCSLRPSGIVYVG